VRVVLLGPPGAGKGTQALKLSEKLGIPQISTGDLFRKNISEGTSLGVEAKRYMDAGGLVPDEVTINMVRDRLADADAADGFLLDGFPRTVPQAVALDKLLADAGTALDLVLELIVEADEVIRRLSGRRNCHGCNKVWHVEFDPPKHPDVCDQDGKPLFRRKDDEPDTIRKRLSTYHKQTEPLRDYYEERGYLRRFDGTRDKTEVHDHIRATLATLRLEERL